MELARLLRILRLRWPVVLVAAIVGFLSGFGFTQLSNENVDPVFEASIPLRFDPQEGQTVEDLSDQVQGERDLAVLAAEPLLAEYSGSSIFADTAGARVVFTARGSSTEEARERAESLVEAYFETDPVIGGDVDQQLQDLEQRAVEIERQIAELQPQLSAEERELVSAHDVLDRQIQAVEDELVLLSVGDLGASEEAREQNSARRDQLRETLGELEAEKASLPERPSDEPPIGDQLRLAGLERSLEILQLDYERLYLRTVGVATSGRLEPTGLTDLTPEPASALLNGTIGLLLSGAIALFGLMGISRLRKELWMVEDLPIPVLGEVADRKVTTTPGPTWYDETAGGQRKDGIQTLRTAIETVMGQEHTALALVADDVGAPSYHALAVDLAASFTSSGRSVLVVDADYSTATEMSEFNVGEPSLGSILRLPASKSDHLVQRIDSILTEAVHIRRDLAVMPSGTAPDSPADALAGPQFGLFMSRATAKFDLLLLIAGPSRMATSRVLTQRAGKALLAVSPGHTTIPSVDAFVRELRNLQIAPVGAVVVHSGRLSGETISLRPGGLRKDSSRDRVDSDHETSPVTRLSFYPSPEGSLSYRPSSISLRNLVSQIGAQNPDDRPIGSVGAQPDDSLGPRVLEAMDNSDPTVLYGPIADYVVTRVEDILTATAGQSSLSPELIDVVLGQGFATLAPVRGQRTAGELLVSELTWELGDADGRELADRFTSTLCGENKYRHSNLDDWLIHEFFVRHIERTDGEPEIWHLASDLGTLQVLVYCRRLTRDRMTQMNVDLVRRMIDEIERLLREAHDEVDFPAISSLEEKLRELHAFEVTLGNLQSGSSEEARLNYPWRRPENQPKGWAPVWAEGIRPNIAPLQRLGLLARPVLSDDELSTVELTG